jgi:uncharacterized NAD(P)/FAD-binding protein YdhS
MKRIIIVGGGLSGAATAMHLARAAKVALDITVVEPRVDVGRGVAYSACDVDHRLNSPATLHIVYPDEPRAFADWIDRTGGAARDPDMKASDGQLYPRRSEFGSFINAEFEAHKACNPSGSMIRHIRASATRLRGGQKGVAVLLHDGAELEADAAVITTSNEQPAIPWPFSSEDASHPKFIANPWDLGALSEISPDARILLLGAGLTAADVMTTVLRDKPRATITAISRSGLRPVSRSGGVVPARPFPLFERLNTLPSLMERRHGSLRSARKILQAFRRDVDENTAAGLPWQAAFDDLRDSARWLWLELPLTEKRRFQRHLRRRYDSFRFRYPPQTEAILNAAETAGRLVFQSVRVEKCTARQQGFDVSWVQSGSGESETETQFQTFDYIVNCVGPSARPDQSQNVLLQTMIEEGCARVSPLGVGLDVDNACRVVGSDGSTHPNVFAFGSLTFATFGYCLGAPFIVDQILREIPTILSDEAVSPTMSC